MVAVFTGAGAGLERGSGAVLGKAGLLGSSSLGRGGEQVFLNAATGNLVLSREDEFLVGRGPDVAATRTYNSLAEAPDDNGDQWRFGAQRRLRNWSGTPNVAGATVDHVGADGSVRTYAYDSASGAYWTTDGAGARDKLVNVGHWVWTDGDTQATEVYDNAGNLISLTDTSGNSISYTYHWHNSAWRLSRATTSNGDYHDYVWSGENVSQITTGYTDLATSTARTLTRTRYAYDGYNRLISVTTDLSPNDNGIADGKTYTTSYTYDGSSLRVASVTQTDGSKVEFAYTQIGGSWRITSVKQWVDEQTSRTTRVDYDLVNRITTVTDQAGAAIKLVYDSAGRLIQTVDPAPYPGANQIITAYQYDGSGNVQFARRYDGFANQTNGITVAQTDYVYDGNGNVTQETDGNGNTVYRTYGAKNELLTEARFASGLYSASELHTTRYVYDGNNRLVFVVGSDGKVTRNWYDSVGQLYWASNFPDHYYNVSGLTWTTPLTETQLNNWCASLGDTTNTEIAYSFFDARGNVTRTLTPSLNASYANTSYAEGYRDERFVYDQAGQLLSRQTIGLNRETFVYDGLGRRIAATDLNGATTLTLYRDGSGKVDTVTIPAGGNLVDNSLWPSAGDDARGPNLVNNQFWAGEKRGENLVDLSGWPGDPNSLPSGYATLPGWNNAWYFADETSWAKAVGPSGQEVAVIRAGQTDSGQEGGGNLSNEFAIDASKAYEFTLYFQWTSASAHRTYFGLSSAAPGMVKNAWDGSENTNPYFTYPQPGEGLQVGRWYKIVGYVLPEGFDNVPNSDLGGIFDAETGAKVQDVMNYRWSENRPLGTAHARFFNFYGEGTQGQYTNFYRPEVRQLNVTNGNATVEGWTPYGSIDDETRWGRVAGPDGSKIWAMQAGQTDAGQEGGGGFTNEVTIDGKKTYEFTYYFRKSDLTKHSIYFGVNTWTSEPWVKNYWDGAPNGNPYFFSADPNWQSQYLQSDRWYKVVGYVFAEGTKPEWSWDAGGVYDTVSGTKIHNVNNYILNEARPNNQLYARFFDFYNENQPGYSTYFGRPEIREFDTSVATPGGSATVGGWHNWQSGETAWERTTGPDGRPVMAIRAGQTNATADGGGNYTNEVTIDANETYEFSLYFKWTDANAHRTYFGLTSHGQAVVKNASNGSEDTNPYFIATQPGEGPQVGRWYKIVGYVLPQGSADIAWGSIGGIFDVETGAKVQNVANFRWAENRPSNDVHARFFNFYNESVQGLHTYFHGASIRRADDTTGTLLSHQDYVRSDSFNRAGELLTSTDSGRFVTGGTTQYRYDPLGRLRMTTDATGNKTYFVYDKLGRKVAEATRHGSWGTMIEYRYDANDKLVATARYANWLTAGQLALLEDVNVNVDMSSVRPAAYHSDIWAWTVYDKEGRVIEAINGDGGVTAYEYDAAGRLVRTTGYVNKLSAGQLDAFKATPPLSVVLPAAHADDSVARNFYHPDGSLAGVLDGEGYLTRILYDNAGRKIHEIAYATPTYAPYRASHSFDYLLSTVGGAFASDRETRYVYDSQGLLRYTIDGLNRVTGLDYGGGSDVHGPARSTTQYAGTIPVLSAYTFASVRAALNAANPDNRTSYSVYDTANRLAYSIDAAGSLVGYSYDDLGRLAKTVQYATLPGYGSLPSKANVDAWVAAYGASSANRISRNYYSDRDELKFTIDAEGYVTRFDYDATGLKVAETRWNAAVTVTDSTTIQALDGLVSGAYVRTQWGYHPDGRLASTIDAEGVTTSYVYNADGTLAHEYRAASTADESHLAYAYDKAGRLTHRYSAYGTAEQTGEVYAYDGLGNIIQVSDWMSSTTRTYDQLGQLLTESRGGVTKSFEYNAFGEVVRTADGNGNASYSYYDRLGRVVVERDAESYLTETSYTQFGEVASVTRRYNRTTVAPSTTVVPTADPHAKDATTSFLYYKSGLVERTIDAENKVERYWYNAFGQRIQVRNKLEGDIGYYYHPSGRLYYEYTYAPVHDASGNVTAPGYHNSLNFYDARGNLTHRIEGYNLPERRDTWFTYDKANRLIRTEHTAVTVLSPSDHASTSSVSPIETFAYDKRGNLIESVAANGARTLSYYDDLDRKIAEIDALGTYTAFTYDGVGNLLSRRVYGTQIALPATAGGVPPTPPGGTNYRETTHTYDALNRLKTTSVANVRTGAWNGSAYALTTGTVTTSYDYDANGNVIKTTDANGGAVHSYYDKLGRKTAEVDQENYLTVWTLDADGNAIGERRYLTRLAGAPSLYAHPAPSAHGEDRVTQFSYDRNGRRLSETREAVYAFEVTGGVLNYVGGGATVSYLYNALGQVVRKTEAAGDVTDFDYDVSGRLKEEVRAGYYDQNGAFVRPKVNYYYNAHGDLVRTRQAANGAAGERVTTYAYDAGGRMTAMTDAAGATRNFYYDAAGNLLRESYSRLKSDGSTSLDGILHLRDLLGRTTHQWAATWNGAAWIGEYQTTAYNAYGEISHRGLNGLWQEQFYYDGMGRLAVTNEGDGVWRFFVHDKAGNRTLTLEEEGYGLGGATLDYALTVATAGGAHSVGGGYVDGINATIAVFDKRGQTVQVRQPQRQLSSSTIQDLTRQASYNAFGEVLSETDARGYTTHFGYNSMGRLTTTLRPLVNYTSASGAVSSANPTEYSYYDLSGRLIGSQDANNNYTTRSLLAGTGFGGTEALVTAEFHADGGVARTFYDHFGDARVLRNELGHDESRSYDAMGRLTQQVHRGSLLTDSYVYDLLGQRIQHWNNITGFYDRENTDYDAQGRIVSQRAFGGETTTTSYSWSSSLVTSWVGSHGGWIETTTHANGLISSETSDRFGRLVAKTDMGGHGFNYYYDAAGRLISQYGAAGQSQVTTYLNTGRASQVVDTAGYGLNTLTAIYQYDANGNRTYEGSSGTVYAHSHVYGATAASETLQNAIISYDALGRITSVTDHDAANNERVKITNEYDLNGNIRLTKSKYPNLAYPQHGFMPEEEKWFAYDSMNRMTVAEGTLSGVAGASGTTIVRGGYGTDLTYDWAGQRRTSTRDAVLTGYAHRWVWYEGQSPWEVEGFPQPGVNGDYHQEAHGYMGARRDTYDYRADGQLTTVHIAEEGYSVDGDFTENPNVVRNGVMGSSLLRAQTVSDALGRTTQYLEYDANGGVTHDRYWITYNAANQVVTETVSQKKVQSGAPTTYVTTTTNSYNIGGTLASTSVDNSIGADTYTSYSYAWYDDGRVASTSFDSDTSTSSNPWWTSSYNYDGAGRLAYVNISDGRPRTVSYASTVEGQILRRRERSAATANPEDQRLFVAGRQVGELTSNGNNDPTKVDYGRALELRNWTNNPISAPFRWNTNGGVTLGAFSTGQGYEALNPDSAGVQGTGSRYTVRAGDTLQSIAATLWGDSSQWYKIAEANGLSGFEGLIAGQSLNVPNRVTNIHNNASTFRAYDGADALGDLSPTAPKPPKKANKCGAFGAILLTVVAVAVTAIVAPWATGIAVNAGLGAVGGAIAGGAVAGVAASVASQGVGLATGIQDKFSWKQVALAGISGAVGGGLSASGAFSGAGSKFLVGALRGAAGSAIAQGVAVATGLQSKFDFAGVAAAGLGGGLSTWAGARTAAAGSFGSSLAANTAGGIANAAVRTLASGGSFGDNLIRALPDVVGSTIGNALAGAVAGGSIAAPLGAAAAERTPSPKPASSIAGARATGRADKVLEPIAVTGLYDLIEGADYDTGRGSAGLKSSPFLQEIWGTKNLTLSAPSLDIDVEAGFTLGIPLLEGNPGAGDGTPARMLTEPGLSLLEGLTVQGNTLTGTVVVICERGTASGDCESVVNQMRLVNQRTSDGYAINLNIRQANWIETNIYSRHPYVYAQFVDRMITTRCSDAGACFIPDYNRILLQPNAPRHYIVHEFLHRLGLGHSGINASVMTRAMRVDDVNHIRMAPQEIRNLVNAYRR